MNEFKIKDRVIGPDRLPLVIADMVINHNCSLAEAI
jgi:sialic acid synthase SpsE